jgi:O-acetylserine/cysteine efflux transporter
MPLLHIGLALLVTAVWGLNFSVIQIGLKEMPPLFFNATRYFLACFPWIFFLKRPQVPFKWLVLYGLFMFAIAFSLLFLGIYFGVFAGLASLLFQSQVFFTLLFAVRFFQEKLHWIQITGFAIAFSGIALVGFEMRGGFSLLGFFSILVGAASWGAGNAVSKKIGKVNMLSLVMWGSLAAWPPILAASLIFEGPSAIQHSLAHLSFTSLGALAYISYASTLLGFGLWSWLIHHHPLSSIAPFALTVPVFGMLASALLLGEPFQIWKFGAFLLILSGLGIHLFGPRIAARFK